MRKRSRGVMSIAMPSREVGVRRREEGKKKWMFAFLLVIFTNCLSAQQPVPLTVGDQLPDCRIKQVLNYPHSALNLKQLKGKSIILDFWNTYCGSCISSFAKLDSLQKRYDGRLVIIAVSSQPATVIQQFLQNHPELKSSSIVFAADDQLLKQYFPYKMIPHLVWLDDNRMVKAITDSKSVTTERLDALLEHRPFTSILKKDVLDFKSGEPLLIHNNGSHENYFSFRSIITPFIAGIPNEEALKNDSASKTTHVYVYNATIAGLCAFALAPFYWIKEQNIIWEVKDSSRFINPGKALHSETEWDQNNRYCYELIAPLMSRDAVKLQMQIDLLRFFNVFARIEKRETEEGKEEPYLIIHQN